MPGFMLGPSTSSSIQVTDPEIVYGTVAVFSFTTVVLLVTADCAGKYESISFSSCLNMCVTALDLVVRDTIMSIWFHHCHFHHDVLTKVGLNIISQMVTQFCRYLWDYSDILQESRGLALFALYSCGAGIFQADGFCYLKICCGCSPFGMPLVISAFNSTMSHASTMPHAQTCLVLRACRMLLAGPTRRRTVSI